MGHTRYTKEEIVERGETLDTSTTGIAADGRSIAVGVCLARVV